MDDRWFASTALGFRLEAAEQRLKEQRMALLADVEAAPRPMSAVLGHAKLLTKAEYLVEFWRAMVETAKNGATELGLVEFARLILLRTLCTADDTDRFGAARAEARRLTAAELMVEVNTIGQRIQGN